MNLKPQPPNNPIAEAATLGACIADPNVIIFVADVITPADFFVPVHKWIAEAAWDCFYQKIPPTIAAVVSKLQALGRWSQTTNRDAATMRDIEAVIGATTTADVDHAISNAEIVKDLSFRRTGHVNVAQAAEDFYNTQLTQEELQRTVLARVGKVFDTRGGRDASVISIAEEERKRIERLQETGDLAGITCGLDWLNERTGGFLPTECWVIAAPYKMRKTSLALNMVLSAAESGAPVSVFTVGDSSRDASYRKLLSMLMARDMLKAGNNIDDVKVSAKGLLYSPRSDIYRQYKDTAEPELLRLPIRLYDGQDLIFNLNEAGRILRRDVAVHGTRLFFYDYAQAADCGRDDYEKTTRFASWMQRIVGELGICGVSLSQKNEATVTGQNESYSPGAKGGGALPAMANVWLETTYDAPNMNVKLRLARDAQSGDNVQYKLHVSSGLILGNGRQLNV